MKWRAARVLVLCVSVGACASDLRPLSSNYAAESGGDCNGKSGINLTICQTDKKSQSLSDAYFEWQNEPALFDIPLMVLAGTAAGLLLFDASGDALKAVGLAAGGVAAGRSYASPGEIRDALLDGADGYACIADYARLVESDMTTIDGLVAKESELSSKIGKLKTLADTASNFSDQANGPESAKSAISSAEAAVVYFNKQHNAMKFANTTARAKARALSAGLLRRIERKPINYAALTRSLIESSLATAKLEAEQSEITQAESFTSAVQKAAAKPGDTALDEIEQLIAEVMRVPNLEEVVGKFDDCIVKSLSGGAT